MNKRDDWYKSTHALRETLRSIPAWRSQGGHTPAMSANYKFGLAYHNQKQLWSIYNLKTDNIIATVRRTDSRVVIRYRKNSVYSPILCRYNYDSPTVHVESPNLRRNIRYVRDNVRSITEQAYEEERTATESVPSHAISWDDSITTSQFSYSINPQEYTATVADRSHSIGRPTYRGYSIDVLRDTLGSEASEGTALSEETLMYAVSQLQENNVRPDTNMWANLSNLSDEELRCLEN